MNEHKETPEELFQRLAPEETFPLFRGSTGHFGYLLGMAAKTARKARYIPLIIGVDDRIELPAFANALSERLHFNPVRIVCMEDVTENGPESERPTPERAVIVPFPDEAAVKTCASTWPERLCRRFEPDRLPRTPMEILRWPPMKRRFGALEEMVTWFFHHFCVYADTDTQHVLHSILVNRPSSMGHAFSTLANLLRLRDGAPISYPRALPDPNVVEERPSSIPAP